MHYSKGYYKLESIKKTIISTLTGCTAIIGICFSLKFLSGFTITFTVLVVFLSVVVYVIILILFKNEIIMELLNKVIDVFKKKNTNKSNIREEVLIYTYLMYKKIKRQRANNNKKRRRTAL